MKIIKKCLIVIVSLFVILATQPTNVFAEDHSVANLQVNDFIAEEDTITHTTNFIVVDSDGIQSPSNTYTANENYFVSEKENIEGMIYIGLSKAVEVTIQHNDGSGPTDVTKRFVPSESKFSIDKNTNTLTLFGGYSYQPSNPNSKFVGWTWKSTAYDSVDQIYKSSHSDNPIVDLCVYDYKITITSSLYDTQTPSNISVMAPQEVETETDVTYYVHLIDDRGNDINDPSIEIGVEQVASDGTTIQTLSNLVYNDGYSLTITTPSNPGQLFYKFSYSSIQKTVGIFVEGSDSDPIIENNAWPWLAACGTGSFYLQTGLVDKTVESDANTKWHWQESSDNGNQDEYEYINDNGNFIKGATTNQLYDAMDGHGTWIRCEIKYGNPEQTVYTKGVQILGAYDVEVSTENDTLSSIYISNGKGAYSIGRTVSGTGLKPSDPYTGKFDILGLYNGKWIHTSFDPSWSIYMKKTEGTITGTGHNGYDPTGSVSAWVVDSVDPTNIYGLDNIKDIYPRFSSYESSNVIFDVRFNNECDAAIYTDVELGSYDDFGDYADYAAIKANMNGESLSNIQMFANKDFTSADETTCTFLITPVLKSVHFNAENKNYELNNVSTFSIDSLYNGTSNTADRYKYWDDPADYYDYYTSDYDYNESVYRFQNLIYKYNTGFWEDDEYYDGYPFKKEKIGGQDIVIGMYNEDSVLSMSWDNTKEISFRFGVGAAGSFGDEVTFEEAGETKEEHKKGGGSSWVEVPNTSASR